MGIPAQFFVRAFQPLQVFPKLIGGVPRFFARRLPLENKCQDVFFYSPKRYETWDIAMGGSFLIFTSYNLLFLEQGIFGGMIRASQNAKARDEWYAEHKAELDAHRKAGDATPVTSTTVVE